LGGSTAELAEQKHWRTFLDGLYKKDWVVYAKPPFAGPEHVFRYLGRYTHRVAISNHRLLDFQDGRVSFTVKNYAQSGQRSVMHLDAVEFLRRFLLHVLPKGYTRIRHFGICAARNLRTKLEAARRLLAALNASHPLPIPQERSEENRPWWKRFLDRTGIDLLACTHCAAGRLIRRRPIEPVYALPPMGAAAGFLNSS
jgi:Putative transposase